MRQNTTTQKPLLSLVCDVCGIVFTRKRRGKTALIACSIKCAGLIGAAAARKEPLNESFWERVDKTPGHGPQGDCWVWTGYREPDGYGEIWAQRKYLTHRASYILTHGPIPDGLWVLHRCDNPPCVRPDHLFLGTHADNMWDAAKKLRGPMGHRRRFSAEDIRAVRALLAKGLSYSEIGRRYSADSSSVRCIAIGKTYKWVPDNPVDQAA